MFCTFPQIKIQTKMHSFYTTYTNYKVFLVTTNTTQLSLIRISSLLIPFTLTYPSWDTAFLLYLHFNRQILMSAVPLLICTLCTNKTQMEQNRTNKNESPQRFFVLFFSTILIAKPQSELGLHIKKKQVKVN